MGFFDSLAEGTVTGFLKGAGSFAKDIRTAITGKEALSSEQQLEIVKMADALEKAATNLEQTAADGQIALNKADAESGSLFKGGWRPSIGWICSFGLGYSFLLKPILPWTIQVICVLLNKNIVLPTMPTLDMGELISLTMCLLGFGGFRMYETIKGVKSK